MALIAVALTGAAFVGGIAFQHRGAGEAPAPAITSEQILEEIGAISQYATLEYRYTNVGKFEDRKDFYGWSVPLTTKSFIITYDGSMKLGLDGGTTVEVVGAQIRITIPPAVVLSHEIREDTVEVLDQSKNIFNQIQIEDYTAFAVEQKQVMERKARDNGLFEEARDQAEQQLGAFLRGLPGIREQYEVLFIRQPEPEAAAEDLSAEDQSA